MKAILLASTLAFSSCAMTPGMVEARKLHHQLEHGLGQKFFCLGAVEVNNTIRNDDGVEIFMLMGQDEYDEEHKEFIMHEAFGLASEYTSDNQLSDCRLYVVFPGEMRVRDYQGDYCYDKEPRSIESAIIVHSLSR